MARQNNADEVKQEQTAAPAITLESLPAEEVAKLVAMVSAQLAPQLAEASAAARMLKSKAKRTYQLERIEDERTVMERVRVPDGEQEIAVNGVMVTRKLFKFVEQKRIVKGGWVVYFPHGHSIFVETEEQLKRLGLAGASGLVDMDTGLSIDEDMEESLKDRVVRSTQPRRRVGGLAAMLEE
jgi:hypothetical protein